MKIILQLPFYFMLCLSCLAQTPLKDGIFKIDSKSYKVEKKSYADKSSFIVREIGRFENAYPPKPKNPYGSPVNRKDIHLDDEMVLKLIKDILKDRAIELSKNKDRIDLSFRLLQENGSIESISYFLPGNTKITLEEISKIDRLIKKNIHATFSGKEYTNFYLINYGNLKVVF